ncbi:MAG: MogA/MoaB family molybdenum cofactor biosynthesis protein [Anaerolineales bacterium]
MNGPVRCAVLTISDRAAAGQREDVSGPALVKEIHALAWELVGAETVSDERAGIERVLKAWADAGSVDVILTTGGTGFAVRDQTPEATQAVIERPAPGLAEAIRAASLRENPHSMLSRGTAGIRGRTLIVNLPGNPRGARQSFEIIRPALPHAVDLLRGDPKAESGHLRRTPSGRA